MTTAPFVKGKRFPWPRSAVTRPRFTCKRCTYIITLNKAWYFTRCDICTVAADQYERNRK